MFKLIKKGFTLIELLIVIAIIGILTAIVTTNLQAVRQRARDTRRKSDLRAIQQSLRLYYNDAKSFPRSTVSFDIDGCGATPCSWGGAFSNSSAVYMNALPTDPSSSTTTIKYKYFSNSDDQYALIAKLENGSDTDIADSQARCATAYATYTSPDKDTATDYVACAQ